MVLYILEIIGTIIFAITGALKGTQKHLDIFGVIVLACCVGVGGGILRDTIGNVPVSALINPVFFISSILTGIFVFIFSNKFKSHDKLINIFDAFGLGLFTFLGANKGLVIDFGIVGIVLSGVITSTGGGVIRDVLSGELPPTILKTDFYATASILGGLLFCLLIALNCSFIIAFLSVFLFVTVIRLIAIYFNINLPKS